MSNNPFHVDIPPDPFLRRAALTAARPLLSWMVKANTFAGLYGQIEHVDPESFAERALQVLNITVDCPADDVGRIPAGGPLIVAANHPHGAADGLLLAAVLGRARSDVRLVANHLLARVPQLRDLCFFVDPFAGPGAAERSRAGLRAAHLWLRRGGALVIFPSGEVAHQRDRHGVPIDSAWRDLLSRMARQTGASVLPAYIVGANSHGFYAAGRLHPALRTALLPRELLNKRGQCVSVRLGSPLPAGRLDGDPGEATARVRDAVEALARGDRPEGQTRDLGEALAKEVSALPHGSCLVESGAFQVFCAEASAIPLGLQEIGRLRAIAFRAAGEGADRAIDLDAFDRRYLHLFSWDREEKKIVGAYRIGRIDAILAADGVAGLYTRTLFRYDHRFVARLSPALELGRAFVRPEYQRSHTALMLLWKGIGRFVAQHSEYRRLIGPVSISTRYSDSSHAMLKAFLEASHLDEALAELVEAVNPPRKQPPAGELTAIVPRTVEDADKLVAQLEADGKGMPVLLRQYLRLNARLIAFNVDPDFGDAVDALMVVDLAEVDPAILVRYLGRADAARFLERHHSSAPPRAA